MSTEYVKFVNQLTEIIDSTDRLELINNHYKEYNKTKDEVHDDFIKALEDKCRNKVKTMISCKSALQQKMLKIECIQWLSAFVGDLKEATKLLDVYSAEEVQVKYYNLRELLELTKKCEEKYLVKGLIPLGGLFLVAAAPKVGKSLLATDLAVTTMLGEPFLNRETVQSNVLYIQNEENLGKTTGKRVFNRGLQELELKNKQLYDELLDSHRLHVTKDIDIVLMQDEIIDKINKWNVKLVLIDSLVSSIKKSGLTELSTELVPALYNLQKVAHENNVTIILLHHATKMASKDTMQGMMSGVAGNNGIMRANDGLFMLFFPDKNSKFTQLHTIPRDSSPIQLGLSIKQGEANYWRYEVINETILSPENLELQNNILRLLFDRWNEWKEQYPEIDDETPRVFGLSLEELVQSTDVDRDEVITRINDMLSTEAIIFYPNYDNKQFTYAIHESGDSWLTVYLEREEENRREIEAKELEESMYREQIQEMANKMKTYIAESNLVEITKLLKPLRDTEKKDVNKLLNNEEKEAVLLLRYPPKYKIGVKVKVIEEEIVSDIIKVVYFREGKEGYHMYSLNEINTRTFTSDQLELYNEIQ